MGLELLLHKYQYTIPVSSLALTELEEYTDQFAEHLPLLRTTIDFSRGVIKLEGDWRYLMAANKNNSDRSFSFYRTRVSVRTTIYPAMALNLDDDKTAGLVFPLDGSIKDGVLYGSCSGLLIIDNIRMTNGPLSNSWMISIYLYDTQFEDCEIKLKIPTIYFFIRKSKGCELNIYFIKQKNKKR